MKNLMTTTGAYIKYVAKVVVGAIVFVLVEQAPNIVESLQGTFVDDPWMTGVLTLLAVFVARNGPKPETDAA